MPKKNHRSSSRKRSLGRRLSDAWHNFGRRISKSFSSVIDYFEWIFHSTTQGVGSVFGSLGKLFIPQSLLNRIRRGQSERSARRMERLEKRGTTPLERLEGAAHRLFSGIGEFFTAIFRLIVPAKLVKSTERAVQSKLSSTARGIGQRFQAVVDALTPRWLKPYTAWVGRLYRSILGFFGAWWFSRDFRALAWSTPAILMVVPLTGAIVLGALYKRTDKIQHYRRVLHAATEAKQPEQQQLCLSKLRQLGYEQLERSEFHTILGLVKEKNWEEAYQRMLTIAPEEKPGFVPGHLWLATSLLDNKIPGHEEQHERWALAERHIQHALSVSPDNKQAERLQVELAAHRGDMDHAVQRMETLVETYPDLHLNLLAHYRSGGDIQKAQVHAKETVKFMERIAREAAAAGVAPKLTEFAYRQWASAYEFQGETQLALDTLSKATQTYPENAEFRQLTTELRTNSLGDLDLSRPKTRKQLADILRSDPEHRLASLLLVRALVDEEQSSLAKEFADQKLITSGHYLAAGDLAAQTGMRNAVRFYQDAIRVDAECHRAWNNLSWIWSHSKPIDMQKALKAANKAIAIEPSPRYHDTRGQIQAKLGHWQAAAADLEKALNGTLPNPGPVHATLARAYKELGDKEKAVAHQMLSGS